MKSKSRRREWKNENEIHTAVTSSSAQPSPPWIELPGDITFNILQRLGAAEMLESTQNVCATWRRVCQDPVRWRVVDLKNPGGSQMRGKFGVLCRQAVNYSQGQLVALSIDNFGDDELVNYIVDRSSNLRRLKLERSYWISGECLAEAVKKLPLLEELHLLYMFSVQVKDIETIGISCPKLKSFTFNERGDTCPSPGYPDDDELMVELGFSHYAPAIADTMPNLRHLRLFSHWIINEGLEAILDGCPHLELLDLRNCHGLDLLGDLGRRCGEQIPDLKHPSDPITETEWLVCNSSCTSHVEADQLSFSGFSDSHSFEYNESDEDFEQYDGGITSDDDSSSYEIEYQERQGIWFRLVGGDASSFWALVQPFGASFCLLLFICIAPLLLAPIN